MTTTATTTTQANRSFLEEIIHRRLVDEPYGRIRTKAFARELVNDVIDGIKQGLREKGRMFLADFGTFSIKTLAARKNTTPQGDTRDLPERKAVRFKAHGAFTDLFRVS